MINGSAVQALPVGEPVFSENNTTHFVEVEVVFWASPDVAEAEEEEVDDDDDDVDDDVDDDDDSDFLERSCLMAMVEPVNKRLRLEEKLWKNGCNSVTKPSREGAATQSLNPLRGWLMNPWFP